MKIQLSPTTLDVIRNTSSNVKIFPNPTTGNFSINLGETYNAVTITVSDINGKHIHSKTYSESQLLNIKLEEPAGVYLLLIESEEKKTVIGLVKE